MLKNSSEIILAVIVLKFAASSARIHVYDIKDDENYYIHLSSFAFIRGGTFEVQIKNFVSIPQNSSNLFGFSFDGTGYAPLVDYQLQDKGCILEHPSWKEISPAPIFYFMMDQKQKKVLVKCNKDDAKQLDVHLQEKNNTILKKTPVCDDFLFDLVTVNAKGEELLSFNFSVYIHDKLDEGVYNLYFYNCPNYSPSEPKTKVSFEVRLTELNPYGYTLPGEAPLTTLYFLLAIIYLTSGMTWMYILRKSTHPVLKIHHLMIVVFFLKVIYLEFASANFYYIKHYGVVSAPLQVIVYTAEFFRSILFFVFVVLLGAGWTLLKPALTIREKYVLGLIFILKVCSNVTNIIKNESFNNITEHSFWKNVDFLDLLACILLLFPVFWTMRHLKLVSSSDDPTKNKKLWIFRIFYCLLAAYIYASRVMVILFTLLMALNRAWVAQMFGEIVEYIFISLVAYKFKPVHCFPQN